MRDAKIKVINAAYSTYTYISNKALKTANFICVTTSHLIRITLLNATNLFPSIISATTPSTTTPLPRLDVNAELYATEVSKTTAKISWRRFNAYELQYIDGVQVKYAEKDKLVC